MTQVTEPYVPLRAIRHLEKGRVVVFGISAGIPYFSTDMVSTQRILEARHQELLVGKNGVDGVYATDPRKDANVTKPDKVSYEQVLRDGFKTVDATIFVLCRDNGSAMRVFEVGTPGNATKALLGEDIDTVLYSENDVL